MTRKVKVFLVFLFITAILSALSFFDVFNGARSANIVNSLDPLKSDSIPDSDQDGLSDSEESYWNTDFQNPDTDGDGFLDGEEVASGNDPRIKSEDYDSLSSTVYGTVQQVDLMNYNITDNVTGLMAGGIVSNDLTRDADPDKKDQAIQTLSLSVINDFYKTQIEYKPPSLNLVGDSKESQVKYLDSLAKIVQESVLSLPQTLALNLDASFNTQTAYFSAKSKQFNSSLNEVQNLDVPKNWESIHLNIINLLYRLYLDYGFIADYDKDMLKAVGALNEIGNLSLESKSILQSIQGEILKNDLSVNSNIYQVMDLIYKNQ